MKDKAKEQEVQVAEANYKLLNYAHALLKHDNNMTLYEAIIKAEQFYDPWRGQVR